MLSVFKKINTFLQGIMTPLKIDSEILWMFAMLLMLFFWHMKNQRHLDDTSAVHIQ